MRSILSATTKRFVQSNSLSHLLITAGYGISLFGGSILVPTNPSTTTLPTNPTNITESTQQRPATLGLNSWTKASGVGMDSTELHTNNTSSVMNSFSQKTTTKQPEIIHESNPSYSERLVGNIISLNSTNYPLREYRVAAVPNDPNSNQWWEAAINAPEAWDTTTGSSDTILAIIDTGFALQHQEFSGRWHENSGEKGLSALENPSKLNCTDRALSLDKNCNLIDDDFDGIVDNESGITTYENDSQLNCSDQLRTLDKSCNLIDDDGNGLADDITGWDYINNDRSVQAGETNPNGSGTKHGSYVTAVAAANTDNAVGIAGVNWNTKILPIQAIDDDGYGNSLSVARAVNYAVAQGADVISMSLGGAYPDAYLRLSLQNAIANGVVIAAASGNDGCNCISYPANYPEIIAVGALDYSLDRASFSSYGDNLDITAPGVGMYTATWSPTNGTSAYASGISGTSLATPLVGGALALLKSQQSTATPLQLTAALLESADQSVLEASAPHSPTLGFGRLDLQSATSRLATALAPTLAYSFSGLKTDAPADAQNVYQCVEGIKGGSSIYTLTKGSVHKMSASLTDVVTLQSNGFTATNLAYGCVLQPHDTPSEIRLINTSAELTGVFVK